MRFVLILLALLTLAGCGPVGVAAIGAGITVAAQAVGLVDQGEALVKDTWLDLHPAPKVCPGGAP